MVKSTKNQRLREKARLDIKEELTAKPLFTDRQKQIEITELSASTREDELVLKVGFRLLPSRASFSRATANISFDGLKVESLRLRVLQGPLATDESEFSSVLDMTGVGEGNHVVKVEIYALWGSDEKLSTVTKEAAVNYVPVKREDRLVRVPIIKSAAGADLAIISESEKNIYREIEENMKRETIGRRDQW